MPNSAPAARTTTSRTTAARTRAARRAPRPPSPAQHATPVKGKVSSGIAGLDLVLGGGLPQGRVTIISGGPGSGKSTMGLQCLLRGATDGHPGILVMFEERAETVRQDALARGWDLARLERQQSLFLLEARLAPDMVSAGDFSIMGLLAILDQRITAMGATHIVLDAVDALLHLYNNPTRERQELYALHEWLRDRKMTAILTAKAVQHEEAPSRYAFLDFMADCVIHVDQRVTAQIATRRLRVTKYRGSGYGRNEYPFIINEDGVSIVPMTSNVLAHRAPGRRVSTGTPWLDTALGGGYRRGTSLMVTGTAGAGKTTLAGYLAVAASLRGERVLYFSFEESPEALCSNLRSTGAILPPHIASGAVTIRAYLPEAMGVEEHLYHSLADLDLLHPAVVVVDAISACARMGSTQAAFEYLMRIQNACKERGITCVYLNQSAGNDVPDDTNAFGIGSLIDTTILLRHQLVENAMVRQLIVVKARGSTHSERSLPFRITRRGLEHGSV